MKMLTLIGLSFFCALLYAYADDKNYQYVAAAMELVSSSSDWDDCIDESSTNEVELLFPTMESVFEYEVPSNRCGYGWTKEKKQRVFDEYLISISLTNHTLLTQNDASVGSIALLCCQEKRYTNSLMAAKNIMNLPSSPYRRYAIALLLDMHPVTYDMNMIVLAAATNRTSMTDYDRYKMMSSYVNSLLGDKDVSFSVKTNAASLFFDKRSLIEDRISIDRLMLSTDINYEHGSNRYLFAKEVLASVNISTREKEYFASITNRVDGVGR